MVAPTKTMIAAGALSNGAIFTPAGVPGTGDVINQAGYPLTIDSAVTLGVDDGDPAIINSAQYPALALAAPITVAAGVQVELRGRIQNSNGNLTLEEGASIVWSNSSHQVLDFGDFDNSASEAPTLTMRAGSWMWYTGSGGSMCLTVIGGGALDLQDCFIVRFGRSVSAALDLQFANDPASRCRFRNAYFLSSRNALNLRFWGNHLMGDIDIDGLYQIAPEALPGIPSDAIVAPGTALRIDGNVDETISLDGGGQPTTSTRIARNVRGEGKVAKRYMQGYSSLRGFRALSDVLTVDGAEDAEDCEEWFLGNTGESFVRLIGSLKNSYVRSLADNAHLVSIARFKTATPEISGNVFEPVGAQDSSDTYDVIGMDAANSAVDYTVSGQTILIENNLALPGPHTAADDGAIFVAVNGTPIAGLNAQYTPTLIVRNNTAGFVNGGTAFFVNESGTTPAGLVSQHLRNIYSNRDGLGPSTVVKTTPAQLGALATDIIVPAQSDENVFHNLPDGLGVPLSAASDAATSTAAPDFADPSRNFASWAERDAGVTADQAAINMIRAGFPGFAAWPAVSASQYSVSGMCQWIRAGWVDRLPAHAGRGITDSAPVEVSSVNGGEPLRAGVEFTLVLSAEIDSVLEVYAFHPATQTRQVFTLGENLTGTQQNATPIQGNLPHEADLLIGVKLNV